jgi:DNA-directed RNA polymerase specialized sigma24 family protein
MSNDTANFSSNPAVRLDLAGPLSPEGADFARTVSAMLDGRSKDDASVVSALQGMESMFDLVAAGLYTLASMLAGEGEDAIRLVETAVANAEVSAVTDPEQARRASRLALAAASIQFLSRRDPASLAAPEGLAHANTCIDDDDLDAAARDELTSMMAGPDRDRVRAWLESLPPAMRVIFVLRAVAGFTAPETAALLASNAGPQAAGWSAEAVRELFRQGLCSLASRMIKAGTRD